MHQNAVFQLYFFMRNMMDTNALCLQQKGLGTEYYAPAFGTGQGFVFSPIARIYNCISTAGILT